MLKWDFEKSEIGRMWKRGLNGEMIETHLYDGNAFMIECYEFTDADTGKDCYTVQSFFIDKDHAKRCLGLVPGTYNIYSEAFDLSVELWGTHKNTIALATMMMKAGITVEYRKEKNK